MLGAALGYHQREAKPFWWAHFDRLRAARRRVVRLARRVPRRAPATSSPTGRGPASRSCPAARSTLTGEWGTGQHRGSPAQVHVVYDDPVPTGADVPANAVRGTFDGDGGVARRGRARHATSCGSSRSCLRSPRSSRDLPLAITPGAPPFTASLAGGDPPSRRVGASRAASSGSPALDVLRRRAPRAGHRGVAGRRRRARTRRSRPSPRPWPRSTTPTSRCRARPAPARPTSARAS